jgi:hypothetical protein
MAVLMPATIVTLVLVLRSGNAADRKLAAEGNQRTGALFRLVGLTGRLQDTAQRLIRERDPDQVEKLMGELKALGQDAGATPGWKL